MKRRKMSARARRRHALANRGLMKSSVLPKQERLKPTELVAKLVITMKTAPRGAVVDVGFDTICRMHGYIPMRVLQFLLAEGYVVVDDSHPRIKVIMLTSKGWCLGGGQG